MSLRPAGQVALALLLVVSAVAGPMAGSAAAQTTVTADCDGSEIAIGGLHGIIDPEVSCGLYDSPVQSQTDAYASALAMADQRESYVTTRSNLEQNIRSLMWMSGKAAAIEALNNGANQSEFSSAFDSGVRNQTSLVVRNDLKRHTAATQQVAYLAAQTDGSNTTNGANVHSTTEPGTAQVTLPNGESMQINSPIRVTSDGATRLQKIPYARGAVEHYQTEWTKGKILLNYDENQATYYGQGDVMVVGPADTSTPYKVSNLGTNGTTAPMNLTETSEQLQEYVTAQDQVLTNGDDWTAAAYSAYADGEVQPSDLWDPITLANEAATEYNSTGYNAFAAAELSALGLTGNTNVSHVVETQVTTGVYQGGLNGTNATYETTTYNATIDGTLFISGSDDMSLDTGTTYDPATLSGTVYMTVADARETATGDPINGTGDLIEVTEQFRIVEATDTQSGEVVNTTTAESKDYDTANASRLENQIDRLIAERNAYEQALIEFNNSGDDSTQQSGIGWPFGGGGQQLPTFIVLTAVIAIVLLGFIRP